MRFVLAVLFATLTGVANGQVTVNGKVQGELWRTNQVVGEVDVFHMLGRRTTMSVKEAWVNIFEDQISIGAKCDQPVLDGEQQSGYSMVDMSGKITKQFPPQIQTITKSEITVIGDRQLNTTRSAMIVIKDGRPESLAFTQVDYADFDIPEFIKRLKSDGSKLSLRYIEELKAFDELGFRTRSFKAKFTNRP